MAAIASSTADAASSAEESAPVEAPSVEAHPKRAKVKRKAKIIDIILGI
jgi:hypothetical protein